MHFVKRPARGLVDLGLAPKPLLVVANHADQLADAAFIGGVELHVPIARGEGLAREVQAGFDIEMISPRLADDLDFQVGNRKRSHRPAERLEITVHFS